MYIWYVAIYEPLPIGGEHSRRMRVGLLASYLRESGHEVEIWLPDFDHIKHEEYSETEKIEFSKGDYKIEFLKGCKYKKDSSFIRYFHNKKIASRFKALASQRARQPDLIISQIPALELAEAVIEHASKSNIPTVIDVRDLWPDVYKRLLPKRFSKLLGFILWREYKRLKKVLQYSTTVTAVSKTYLEWATTHSGRKFPDTNVHFLGYDQNQKVNVNLSWAQFCAEKSIPENKVYIFFSGTFCDSYDFRPICCSAQYFDARNDSRYHFIVAGEGELDEHVRDTLEKAGNISLVGWLNESELRLCLSNVHLGLAPYDRGALMSLTNKLFEYLAYGLPIISSLRGELFSIIEKNSVGENYDSETDCSLSDAILNLTVNQEVYNGYRSRARRLYKSQYSTDAIYSLFVKQIELIGKK